MDELDLLRDPDDAATAPMRPVPGHPMETTGPLPYGPVPNEPGPYGPVPSGLVPFGTPAGSDGPGAHRHDAPSRPWAWLIAVVAAALIAVAGLVWMIGSAIGGGDRQPVAAPVVSATAPLSLSAPSTVPVETATPTVPTPSSVPTVTIPPAPSVTRVVPTPKPTPSVTPRFVRVPDVVGDRVRTATRSLENAGFKVSVVGLGENQDNRRVAAQSPGGGGRARYGSTVVLLVGGR